MREFDYKEVKIDKGYPSMDKNLPIKRLQEFGSDGWDVVSISEEYATEFGYGTEKRRYYWQVLLKKQIE